MLYLASFNSIRAFDAHLNPDWFSLIVVRSGAMDFTDGTSLVHLSAGDIYAVPRAAELSTLASPLQICLLSCTMGFAVTNRTPRFKNACIETMISQSPFVIATTEAEVNHILWLFEMLDKKASRQASMFQVEIVVLCVNLILYEYCELCYKYGGNTAAVCSRNEKIVIRFITLVEYHVKVHHDVKFYADSLFVSEGHLRKAVRGVLGQSAKNFIEMSVISEASALLGDSSLSINEIAEQLSFSSSQSFSGFYKRHTKLTPTQYRQNLSF